MQLTHRETTLDHNPIPDQKGIDGWQGVAIHESGEKLVSLSELDCRRIIISPAYHAAEIPDALNAAYVREGVANRLVDASRLLPSGISFAILDAWRPFAVQEALFSHMLEVNRKLHPHLSTTELAELSEQSVARPVQDVRAPYPHSTGGAIDVSLADVNGNQLEMGACFDEVCATTPTRYFEEQVKAGHILSGSDRDALKNRRRLFFSLRSVGFTNYHKEWWHFDYGNQLWAVQENATAIYGMTSL